MKNYRVLLFILLFCALVFFNIISSYTSFISNNNISSTCQEPQYLLPNNNMNKYANYTRHSPLIFIGGFPRSGTTLIRSMLDAHADVRCGEETRVVPKILNMVDNWMKSSQEMRRLTEAGLTEAVLGDAVAAFILEVVVKHGELAPRLCNKDPFTLKSGAYLMKLFPAAKFIFMIRDGRASVHSLIERNVTIESFNLTNPRQCLRKWSKAVKTMLAQCDEIGESRCLKVKYEELVLHPRSQMRRILNYLELPWTEAVLHHQDFVNKPGGISLSKVEPSTNQVVKPVNVEALSKWVGTFPKDVVQDMESIAPSLKLLGYNPKENKPNYGVPDSEVVAENKN